MGFMDKAKKMAEQAQAKIDEAQKQFNTTQGAPSQPSGPVQQYDEHGRPIPPSEPPPAPAASMEETAPLAAAPPPPPVPGAAAPVPEPPAGEEDRNRPSYAPPPMSSGDPLAG